MALNVYRRHRRDCKSGHPEDSKSGEFEERKKNWKRCDCPIFASGTLAGKFGRRSTGQWEWIDARPIFEAWEKAGRWDGDEPAKPQPQTPQNAPVQITIERAVKAFLSERSESAASSTLRKARYLLNDLQDFSAHKGYVLLDQWATIDVRDFRSSWEVAPNTAAKYLEIVKGFFEFAVSNGWLQTSPAKPVKNTKGKSSDNEKERVPFTDEEIARMLKPATKITANELSAGREIFITGRRLAIQLAIGTNGPAKT